MKRTLSATLLLIATQLTWPTLVHAKDKKGAAGTAKKTSPNAQAVSPDAPNPDAAKGQDYQVVTSNKFDFEAASIDGRMKAPMGFMLQGRKSHSQVNMVELRSNFRNELIDSKSAVMAIPVPIP